MSPGSRSLLERIEGHRRIAQVHRPPASVGTAQMCFVSCAYQFAVSPPAPLPVPLAYCLLPAACAFPHHRTSAPSPVHHLPALFLAHLPQHGPGEVFVQSDTDCLRYLASAGGISIVKRARRRSPCPALAVADGRPVRRRVVPGHVSPDRAARPAAPARGAGVAGVPAVLGWPAATGSPPPWSLTSRSAGDVHGPQVPFFRPA